MLKVRLANPRGFCAGVDRAIGIVDRAIELFGKPIYVRHEVVHNRYVVNRLKQNGAVFVEELDEVPDDAIVIFSAHGVPKSVQQEAKRRGLRVFDATCPLVTKVHMEVARHSKSGRECILIGHQGHPEVIGTMGQYEPNNGSRLYLIETPDDAHNLEVTDPRNLAFVTQTTLSMDDAQQVIDVLKNRFPGILGPKSDDICYATQNRQDAVKKLSREAGLVLVVGSPNSSNSNRLREIADKYETTAYLIDSADQIEDSWLKGVACVGVTAGASAPEILVAEVVERLQTLDATLIQNDEGKAEEICFPLPKELA